jgi:hypothetical protein
MRDARWWAKPITGAARRRFVREMTDDAGTVGTSRGNAVIDQGASVRAPNIRESTHDVSVGAALALSASHIRGLHALPHPGCWRCERPAVAAEVLVASDPDPAEQTAASS